MPPRSRRLQPADDTLLHAVHGVRPVLKLADEDEAMMRLAEHYAEAIDSAPDKAEALERLGPKLLTALESLGASPGARARLVKGAGASGPSRLDVLRARRPG